MFYRLLLWFSLTIIPAALLGQQVLFNNTYDFTESIEGSASSISTLDGGFISLCDYSSLAYDSILLVKLDVYGCQEWAEILKVFSGTTEYKNGIRQYSDSSYLVLIGFNNLAYEDNNGDLGLVKFSKDGELLWSNSYGWEDRSETGHDLQILPDGGAILTGNSAQWVDNNTFYERLGCVIRVNADGQEEWSYIHDVVSIFTKASVNSSENVVVLGSSGLEVDSVSILLEFDLEGEILVDTYAFPLEENMYSNSSSDMTYTQNGEYIVCGYETYNWGSDESFFVYRLNKDFELLWLYLESPSSSYHKRPRGIIELKNGDIFVGGFKDSLENDFNDVGFLAKFSPTGQLLWEKTYTAPQDGQYFQYDHLMYNLENTFDDNILTTGWTSQIIPGNPQINTKLWLMKVDSAGNFTVPLLTAVNAEKEILCIEESSAINIEINSTNGCYDVNWSGNGAEFVQEDANGNFYFQSTESGIYDVFCNINDDVGHNSNTALEFTVIPTLTLPTNDTILPNETLNITQDFEIDLSNWSGSGMTYANEINGNLVFESDQAGLYYLLFDQVCGDEQVIQIVVDDGTGVEAVSLLKVAVSPNPAKDHLILRFSGEPKQPVFNLYNEVGQIVKAIEINDFSQEQKVDINELPSGIYYWQLGTKSGKLIIQ